MEVEQTWRQRNDRTVRENQVHSFARLHAEGVFNQRDSQATVKRDTAAIMIAAREIYLAVEQRYQRNGRFLLPQCQIPKVENYIVWSDPAVPVFDNQFLPALGPAAKKPDIRMKEVGIRDDPRAGIEREISRGGSHG